MRETNKVMKKIEDIDRIELSNDISGHYTKIESDNNKKRLESYSSIATESSCNTHYTAKTLQSVPFNKELDLDLPNFGPTKYASQNWKVPHSVFYFFYSGALLASNLYYILKQNYIRYNILGLIAHICYFISSFLEWLYFRRGCIGPSNYNSRVKDNIDKSLKARILRAEEGCKYFFSFIASNILIYGNISYILFNNKYGNKYEEGIIPDNEFWNINLVGVMTISLAQILKIQKILTETKQYIIKNDLSNCLIEIFLYFSSLCFGTLYFFNIVYNYDNERFELLYIIIRLGGSVLTLFSSLSLINRYYFITYDDLNVSDLSNVTF